MKKTNYNQKKAATLLGISRDALIRRMKKFHIKIEKGEQEKWLKVNTQNMLPE